MHNVSNMSNNNKRSLINDLVTNNQKNSTWETLEFTF